MDRLPFVQPAPALRVFHSDERLASEASILSITRPIPWKQNISLYFSSPSCSCPSSRITSVHYCKSLDKTYIDHHIVFRVNMHHNAHLFVYTTRYVASLNRGEMKTRKDLHLKKRLDLKREYLQAH